MAVTTTADYKAVLNKVLHQAKNGYGLVPEELVRHAGVSQADLTQIISEYETWRLARGTRIGQTSTKTATA